MKVSDLLEMGFESQTLPCPDREIKNAYIGDLLSWVMKSLQADEAWVTIMSNINILAVASLADAAVIILAEGVTLDEGMKATAAEKEINVLTTNMTAFEVAKLLADKV